MQQLTVGFGYKIMAEKDVSYCIILLLRPNFNISKPQSMPIFLQK